MRKIYPLFIILMVLNACKEDTELDQGRVSSDIIKIKAYNDGMITRGTPINSVSDSNFDNIYVYAYKAANFDPDVASESYFTNGYDTASKNSSTPSEWNFPQTYYWPNDGYNLTFLSYFAYPATENGVSINNGGLYPVIEYTVPGVAANQPDLMIATSMENQAKQEVALNFNHALACVGFQMSAAPGNETGLNELDYIYVTGVYGSGDIPLLCNGEINWNLTGDTTEKYYVGLSEENIPDELTNITAVDGYLMMLPQSLDGATIVIKFKGLDDVKTVELASGSEWKAGTIYIYNLAEGLYTFNATATTSTCPYLGGPLAVTVNSNYTNAGVSQDMGWTAEITYPEGTDEWVTDLIVDGKTITPGSIIESTGGLNVNISAQAPLSSFTSTTVDVQWLQEATPVSNLDLSEFDGLYCSANCYVVNGPGTYKFPCWVMGNGLYGTSSALSSETLNENCFDGSSNFVDYKNNPITTKEDLIISGATSADIVWMCAPELITDVNTDGTYVTFTVNEKTIQLGNAIIAVKNQDGIIMWSWQIWITPWKIPQLVYKGNTLFYGENLGLSLPAKYVYPENTATITFTQNDTNIKCSVTLTQTGYTKETAINNPYYQWGRKDPMLPTMGNDQDIVTYPADVFKVSGSPASIGESIQNPNVFYSCSDNGLWATNMNTSLWGIPNGTTYYKSIYDPSPISFCMPISSDITKLTPQGWSPAYPGFAFKYNNSSLFFMAVGNRNYTNGALQYTGIDGYNWTKDIVLDNGAYSSNAVQVSIAGESISKFNTGYAFSVMPVLKEAFQK